MVYDISNMIAERERLVGELQWFQQQPETVWKRNEINKRVNRINQLDQIIQRDQIRSQYGQMQYNYGYQQPQNISPYVNQPQMPPMNSPYQDRYSPVTNIGFNQPMNGGTSGDRYASKPLPSNMPANEMVTNEPVGSYRVESNAKPVKKEEPKQEVKHYTGNSFYPLICDKDIKEIERKLDNGLYERCESKIDDKNLEPYPTIILEKTKENISSTDDFYNKFIQKLDFTKPKAYIFNNISSYAVPTKHTEKEIADCKEELKHLHEEIEKGYTWKLEGTLTDIDSTRLPFIIGHVAAKEFNSILRYCYNSGFSCDDFLRDGQGIQSVIDQEQVLKDKEKYYETYRCLNKIYSQMDLALINDGKSLKITVKYPTMTFYSPDMDLEPIFHKINRLGTPFTLRKQSFKALYDAIDETFKFFGKDTKYIRLKIIDVVYQLMHFNVYVYGKDEEKQFIIVKE